MADPLPESKIPGGLSEAGKQFMDALPPAVAQLADISAAANIREQGHAEYIPRADRAIEKYGIECETTQIAGVECLNLCQTDGSTQNDRTILYFFGGGYVYGGAYDDICISAALCRHTGARIISPQYRLAPEHPWPAAPDDGFKVYSALIAELEPSNIALAGESAGGNLALAVIHRAKKADMPLPESMALLSPWCDLTRWKEQLGSAVPLPQDPTLHPDDLDHYANCHGGENAFTDPDISPIYGSFDRHFPRTMISTGTRDILMPQCIRLARTIQNAGAIADLRIYPGLCHVFECYDEIPEAELSLKALSDFLF